MRRSILSSLVVIGAAVAVLLGAGTFGQFTASDTLSQSNAVTAARLGVDAQDYGPSTAGANSLSFDLASVCDKLQPGQECKTKVIVCNGDITISGPDSASCAGNETFSNVAFKYANGDVPEAVLDYTETPHDDCLGGFTIDTAHIAGVDGVAGIQPGQDERFEITITLDPENENIEDINACMGIEATVTFTVDVIQLP